MNISWTNIINTLTRRHSRLKKKLARVIDTPETIENTEISLRRSVEKLTNVDIDKLRNGRGRWKINLSNLSAFLPTHTDRIKTRSSIKRIVVHTTDGEYTPYELAEYSVNPNQVSSRGAPSSFYTFLIKRAGEAYQLTPSHWVTWHVGNWNTNSLAIALDYKTLKAYERAIVKNNGKAIQDIPVSVIEDHTPTVEMLDTLLKLLAIRCIVDAVHPSSIYGHRELPGTGFIKVKGSKRLKKTCPGMSIDMNEIRKNVMVKLQVHMRELNLYSGPIDGIWGKGSRAAFEELLMCYNATQEYRYES